MKKHEQDKNKHNGVVNESRPDKNPLRLLFGGLNITWPRVIIFAIIMGIWTALMAMLVPDGNSFHDIAVTMEWWVLPALIIITNTKKPLEAALKTFVFFLISQPLVYLIQVPFNSMGWGLFSYYRYWFQITLLTIPGAFFGWFIKKDKWYSGLILSAMTCLLIITGLDYIHAFSESFPNHLISVIYCFLMVPILIFGVFRQKVSRIIAAVASLVCLLAASYYIFVMGDTDSFTVYNNNYFEDQGIVLVGQPRVKDYTSDNGGNVELITYDDGYTMKISGHKGREYNFTVVDDENEYNLRYYYDKEMQTIVIAPAGESNSK